MDWAENMTEATIKPGFPEPVSDDTIVPLTELEAWAIARALHICRGRVTEAARRLGIGRSTLYRKIEEYRIDLADVKAMA